MKNSIYETNREVPSVHTGCSLAETGWNEYDDFDNSLKPLNVIPGEKKDEVLQEKFISSQGFDGYYDDKKLELLPEFTKPSSLRTEPLVTITVPSGIHPITLLKPEVINHAWIILDKDVVEKIKDFTYKFKQNTFAFGEFFRLENNDTFTLQKIEYFEGWRVLRECNIDGVIFQRPECPEFIVEMIMEKYNLGI